MAKKRATTIKSLLRLVRNFIGQNFLYMDTTERIFKIFIEFSLFVAFFFILKTFFDHLLINISISIILAHTFNWLFNGSVYKILLDEHFIQPPRNAIEIKIGYIERVNRKSTSLSSIQIIAIFGSVSRGTIKERSDLDFRLVRRPGILNGIRACRFILAERIYCLFNKVPLCGGYIGDNVKYLYKMNKDEVPIILKNENNNYPYKKLVDPIETIKKINGLV